MTDAEKILADHTAGIAKLRADRDALRAERDALAAQVAALRGTLEIVSGHEKSDGCQCAIDLLLTDTATAAAQHDAEVRREERERIAAKVESLRNPANIVSWGIVLAAIKEQP